MLYKNNLINILTLLLIVFLSACEVEDKPEVDVELDSNIGGRVISYDEDSILIYSDSEIVGHISLSIDSGLIETIDGFEENKYFEFKIDMLDESTYPMTANVIKAYNETQSNDSSKFNLFNSKALGRETYVYNAIIIEVMDERILANVFDPVIGSAFSTLNYTDDLKNSGETEQLKKAFDNGTYSTGDLITFISTGVVFTELAGFGIGDLVEVISITDYNHDVKYNGLDYKFVCAFGRETVPIYYNENITCSDTYWDICSDSIVSLQESTLKNFEEMIEDGYWDRLPGPYLVEYFDPFHGYLSGTFLND